MLLCRIPKRVIATSNNTRRTVVLFSCYSTRKMEVQHVDDSFVGAIDQGTTSTRFFVFNSKGEVVNFHQMEFEQIKPKAGYIIHKILLNFRWCEHDPMTILQTVNTCIEETIKKCPKDVVHKMKAIGLTNQRETTVVWDKRTGKPLHNAIGTHLFPFI